MNMKIIIIPVIAVAAVLAAMSLMTLPEGTGPSEKNDVVFHITLADPELYGDGAYAETFHMESGQYHFRFVPNGSSPEVLSISLNGDGLEFSEDFELKGTLHETGISEYYTWEYLGENRLVIPQDQQVTISINPNGNVMGSVSVDILEN